MRILLAVPAAVLLAACGGEPEAEDASPSDPPSSASPAQPTRTFGEEHRAGGIAQPPPFRVRYDHREIAIRPHAYCYDSGCVDGIATDPPRIGSPRTIEVYVPVDRFELQVHLTQLSRDPEPGPPVVDTCGGRTFEAPVDDLGEGWYGVPAFGPAGLYDVSLFAQGGGDMIGSLLWRTTVDGAMPEPSASLALIADNDGEPDSYGLELSIDNLAQTPRRATASIAVTAGNGRSMTIEAVQAKNRCRSEGDLYFDRPDRSAKAAAALGPLPFTTTVTLTLDGRTYRATAVYPDDEIKGNEPNVRLDFSPPLPSL